MVRHQGDVNFSADILLDAIHHCFHVPHHRIQVHCLVHLLPVPSCNLVFPINLSFGKCVFLKQMVRFDQNQRCCCLEAYSSLDADDGVSDMDVPADSERCCNLAERLNQFYRIHLLAVKSDRLTFLKCDCDFFRSGLGHLGRVGLFRKHAVRRQGLDSSDAGAPKSLID